MILKLLKKRVPTLNNVFFNSKLTLYLKIYTFPKLFKQYMKNFKVIFGANCIRRCE
jgi:hypothetical protein